MARIYSSIAKFKRVEYSARQAANALQGAIQEIDREKSRRRTNAELETLDWFRERCATLRQQTIDVLGQFYNRVEGREIFSNEGR